MPILYVSNIFVISAYVVLHDRKFSSRVTWNAREKVRVGFESKYFEPGCTNRPVCDFHITIDDFMCFCVKARVRVWFMCVCVYVSTYVPMYVMYVCIRRAQVKVGLRLERRYSQR